MARIVLGIGTSHSPMLTTPWNKWDERVKADRQNDALAFRGGTYDFTTLSELRAREHLEDEITQEKWQARHAACQAGIDTLAAKFVAVEPDAVVIIGNDQQELFTQKNMAAGALRGGCRIIIARRINPISVAIPTVVRAPRQPNAPIKTAMT
jgi:3-O-methylgallate 3,4-dioxygenase